MIIKKIKGKRNKGFYCICICDYCGKEFERRFGLIKIKKNHFCTNECKYKWRIGKNHPLYGKKLSEEHKQKLSIAFKGENNPNYGLLGKKHPCWKGGRIIQSSGYVLIKKHNHPNHNIGGYVREHRLIMERHLGRYLTKEEVVHHVDEDRENNKIENLMLFPDITEHLKYHKEILNNGRNS